MGDTADLWEQVKAEAAARGDFWHEGRSQLVDGTDGHFVDVRSHTDRNRCRVTNRDGRTVRLIDFEHPDRVYPGTSRCSFDDAFDRRIL